MSVLYVGCVVVLQKFKHNQLVTGRYHRSNLDSDHAKYLDGQGKTCQVIQVDVRNH